MNKPADSFSKNEKKNIRLNKFISNSGVCSRREADALILSGLVHVNGVKVTTLGEKISEHDTIIYKGKTLSKDKKVYVLLNKPKKCVTTLSDPEGRKTVMDLVSKACTERIYPVGRLDYATTGVLLFTNDGDLAKLLSHPSSNVKKIYHATLHRDLEEEDLSKIRAGIRLKDGLATVDAIHVNPDDRKSVGIEIHSGKNRILRRIFERLGYMVDKLDRTSYAGLTKIKLERGDWRHLSHFEVMALKGICKNTSVEARAYNRPRNAAIETK